MDDYILWFLYAVGALYVPLVAYAWWQKRKDTTDPYQNRDSWGMH